MFDMAKEIEQEYARRRERCAAEEARREAEAFAACPELKALTESRLDLVLGGVAQMLQGAGSRQDLLGQMAEKNRQIAERLVALGHPADWLDPIYECPDCRDTGYTGEPLKRECACRQAIKARLKAREIGLTDGEASFERFDEKVFPNEPRVENGIATSQRKQMIIIRRLLEDWCARYPEVRRRNLLLRGKSGLGKTYLLSCVARRLSERGVSCLLVSAFQLVEAARRAIFQASPEDWNTLLTVPVLLLDDLGTEPVYQNITLEYLYQLIDTRQRAGLATFYSTNFTEEELRTHYNERIASRLLDVRSVDVIPFEGVDVRQCRLEV